MANYIEIPTYKDGAWTSLTTFITREDFRIFIRSIFKDAGPDEGYNFTTSISHEFNCEKNYLLNLSKSSFTLILLKKGIP